ncbi:MULTISPECIES: hypothetical protein [unclassified Microcoleus]|uniref:hypothetical protein n=1 Tax=unclassified Microcoleus TaxID=2642155 RepID=UPI0025D21CA9|nr:MULTISPECIES: hypothetical protein [unclassified Microcoleus]
MHYNRFDKRAGISTPEILQQQAIDKWNGQFPTVMGSNEALPLINTPGQSATPGK